MTVFVMGKSSALSEPSIEKANGLQFKDGDARNAAMFGERYRKELNGLSSTSER